MNCLCGCGQEHRYQEDEPIWWYDHPRGGYGPSRPVKASFVKYNEKTVTISAQLKNGGTRTRYVSLANIKPREKRGGLMAAAKPA